MVTFGTNPISEQEQVLVTARAMGTASSKCFLQ